MSDNDETTTDNTAATQADSAASNDGAAGQTKRRPKKTAKKTPRKTAGAKAHSSHKSPVRNVDRAALGEKVRVFSLAKQLGMTSRELVVTLNELGMVKVAQSSLTRAETEQLLDALDSAHEDTNAGSTADDGDHDAGQEDAADEKIRHRVRKDVENEINQIESKVDAELLSDAASEPAPEPESEPEAEPADDAVAEPVTADVSEEAEGEEPATDVYAPVFKPASRTSRRRASRTTAKPRPEQGDEEQQRGVDTQADAADAAPEIQSPKAIKGSSRLEAQRRRRTERREEERKRSRVVSQAEFLARRESVERTMVVRERDRHDGPGKITQVGVLEDGLLVEHFVDSDDSASMIGNIYLGRVQNVLPSMEAAFIDIGQGRNGVLYAGEVDWKAAGLGGRSRRIEQALKSGDQVLVQVTKDPVGHKGARLSTQISLAGRYLVYVPGGRSAGISRKLPAPERKRLKDILAKVVPGKGGAIIRTAAEGAPEEAIAADVARLHNQWVSIQEQAEKEKKSKGAKPVTLYEEPRLLVKVVRDLFNEDFNALVVDGTKPWNVVHNYVQSVAPDLLDRVEKFDRDDHDGHDAFEVYRVDEQIQKALSRTVWLPSGGTLVIDRTEAMTVIDVNTGKFTGSGGSLEETVTSNNLEAAEEIVRQLRLRDIGGMIIIDFIDMILPENQELVLRRLKEALGRDRTRHQVSEVTSLGLVQLTRKRLGTGLVETFSTPCQHCGGRGIVLSDDPVDHSHTPAPVAAAAEEKPESGSSARRSRRRKAAQRASEHPTAAAMRKQKELVDAVVMTDSAPETDTDAAGEKALAQTDHALDGADERSHTTRRSARRRGRRGSGRGRGKEQHTAEAISETQGDEKADSRSRVAQTYEEAVEEFERSPRRKRATRGNSKSDHRPEPEEFVQPEPAHNETQADTSTDNAGSGAQRTGGRGRRRAVRKTRTTQTSGTDTAAQVHVNAETTTQAHRSRGRRRATRKS